MPTLKLITRKFSLSRTIKKMANLSNINETDRLPETDPKLFPSPFPSNPVQPTQPTMTTAKLSNGITLLASDTSLPSTVTMGLLLKIGSRDETPKTSGALHSIKATLYKSFLRTNETINHGMVQMSGGRYSMDFTREHALYKASCLSHDTVDIFTMLTDCAMEPKNYVSSNVGAAKLPHNHLLAKMTIPGLELTDKLMKACFGLTGLGNKLLGEETNIGNLDAYTMQQFQLKNVATEDMVVCGLGVRHPEEFFELAELRLGSLRYNQTGETREKSVFRENDVRNIKKGASGAEFALGFEGSNWESADLMDYYVLSELLGGVEVNEYDALNNQTGLLYNNLYKNNAFIDGLEATNSHFTDSGVFVLRGSTSTEKLNNTLELLAGVFKGVANVSEEDVNAAKKRIKIRLLRGMEDEFCRVEESMKQMSVFGEVRFGRAVEGLQKVNKASLGKLVQKLGQGKMSVVLESEDVSGVYNHQKIKKLFAQ